jgi:hypothetical protein
MGTLLKFLYRWAVLQPVVAEAVRAAETKIAASEF